MTQLQCDHYGTLGVWVDDTGEAIRHAYHDLDRRSRSGTGAAPPFAAAIERAFEVLSDRRRRQTYDRDLTRSSPTGGEPGPAALDLTTLDLLRDFEGEEPPREDVWSEFRSNFAADGPPKSGRIAVLELRIRAAASALLLDPLVVDVPVFRPCPACHGIGSIDAYPCSECDHSGLLEARATIAVAVAGGGPVGERVVSLEHVGVRTPLLHVQARVAD